MSGQDLHDTIDMIPNPTSTSSPSSPRIPNLPRALTLKSMAESPNQTPNLLYLSISQNNETLFSFNPHNDTSLETLASLFLQNPPPFHSHFSHSSHSRTFAFLLDPDPPLTCFFAISPTSPNLLHLLRQIKNLFKNHRGANLDAELLEQFFSTSNSSNSNPSSFVSMEAPLLGMGVGRKNSNSSSSMVVKIDGVEMSNMDSNLVQKSSSFSSRSRQVGRRLWWRHVKIVVVADLFLCMVLFGIWLAVCRGFRCLA